jgi:hypothetical protein
VSILYGLLPCTRLTCLTIGEDWQASRLSISAVPVSPPVGFAPVAMPRLQILEIPMSTACLDLQGCPQLHSLHIMYVFEVNPWWPPSRESSASITVGLRKLSRMFKMPHRGRWTGTQGYPDVQHAHWHARGYRAPWYCCSPVYAIEV